MEVQDKTTEQYLIVQSTPYLRNRETPVARRAIEVLEKSCETIEIQGDAHVTLTLTFPDADLSDLKRYVDIWNEERKVFGMATEMNTMSLQVLEVIEGDHVKSVQTFVNLIPYPDTTVETTQSGATPGYARLVLGGINPIAMEYNQRLEAARKAFKQRQGIA